MSVYHKVGTAADLPEDDPQVDLSWQLTLQKVWESLVQSEIGSKNKNYVVLNLSDLNSILFFGYWERRRRRW